MGFFQMTNAAGSPLNTIYAESFNQTTLALTGQLDPGGLKLIGPTSAPASAPTVTLQSGTLTGTGYQWGVYWITGMPDGTGAVHVTGRTTVGPYSAAQNLSSQQATIDISSLPVPVGVIGWGVARNASGGTTFYSVPNSEQFVTGSGLLATTFVDQTPDANLVTAAPSVNTTGSTLEVPKLTVDGSSTLGSNFTASNAKEIDVVLDGNAGGTGTNAQKYYWARTTAGSFGLAHADYALVAYDGSAYYPLVVSDYTDKQIGLGLYAGWQVVTHHNTLDDGTGKLSTSSWILAPNYSGAFSSGVSPGFSFIGDASYDTGMFSPSDGIVELRTNGMAALGLETPGDADVTFYGSLLVPSSKAINIGSTSGTNQNNAITMGNALSTTNYTQIGNNNGLNIQGVGIEIFGIAQANVNWLLALDRSGNLGLTGALYLGSPLQSFAGTSGGTVYWVQSARGSALKIVVIYLSNYENDTTTSQTITYPVPFALGMAILNAISGISITSSLTAATIVTNDNTTVYDGTAVIIGI